MPAASTLPTYPKHSVTLFNAQTGYGVETSSYLNKDYVSPFEPKFYQVSRATAQSQSVTPHSPFALPTSNSLSLSFSQTQTLYPPPPSPPPPLSLTHSC